MRPISRNLKLLSVISVTLVIILSVSIVTVMSRDTSSKRIQVKGYFTPGLPFESYGPQNQFMITENKTFCGSFQGPSAWDFAFDRSKGEDSYPGVAMIYFEGTFTDNKGNTYSGTIVFSDTNWNYPGEGWRNELTIMYGTDDFVNMYGSILTVANLNSNPIETYSGTVYFTK